MLRFFGWIFGLCLASYFVWQGLVLYSNSLLSRTPPTARQSVPTVIINLADHPKNQSKETPTDLAKTKENSSVIYKVDVFPDASMVQNTCENGQNPAPLFKVSTNCFVNLSTLKKKFPKQKFFLNLTRAKHGDGELLAQAIKENEMWEKVFIFAPHPMVLHEITRWLQPNPLKDVPASQPFPENPTPHAQEIVADPIFVATSDEIMKLDFLDSLGLVGFFRTKAKILVVEKPLSPEAIKILHHMGKTIFLTFQKNLEKNSVFEMGYDGIVLPPRVSIHDL